MAIIFRAVLLSLAIFLSSPLPWSPLNYTETECSLAVENWPVLFLLLGHVGTKN